MKVILCYGDSNTHGTVAMRGPDDIRRGQSDAQSMASAWVHSIPKASPTAA